MWRAGPTIFWLFSAPRSRTLAAVSLMKFPSPHSAAPRERARKERQRSLITAREQAQSRARALYSSLTFTFVIYASLRVIGCFPCCLRVPGISSCRGRGRGNVQFVFIPHGASVLRQVILNILTFFFISCKFTIYSTNWAISKYVIRKHLCGAIT
jgi:hypothetical protein